MEYLTPLRYPGGKRKLANYVRLLVHENKVSDGHYVEPYCGGAAVALALLFGEYVSQIHINDLNRSVHAFWHAVLNNTESLCRKIQETPVTMDEWYRQRSVQETPDQFSNLDLGFSTFFLNRTNRSGIVRGGVIGGQKQNGKWKLDARFNKQSLIERVRRIARYRERIKLYNQDASDLLREVVPDLPVRTLVYLDPPYYKKGEDLYENHYKHADHAVIADLVTNVRQPWIVSYDNLPEVIDLYSGFRRLEYKIHYSAQERYKGSEVMFFCHRLSIPEVPEPARTSDRKVRRVEGFIRRRRAAVNMMLDL